MNILLDTHIALWAVTDSPKLRSRARDFILEPSNELFVSAATLWEITIKHSLGKKLMPVSGNQALAYFLAAGYEMLSITPTHAITVEDLPGLHRDPFARILIAQAISEPLHLLTHDKQLEAFSDLVIRAWQLRGSPTKQLNFNRQVFVLGMLIFLSRNSEHLDPAADHSLRLRQVLAQNSVQRGQVARRHGRKEMMIDVVVQAPEDQPDEGADAYGPGAKPVVVDVVWPADVLRKMPEALDRRPDLPGDGDKHQKLPTA